MRCTSADPQLVQLQAVQQQPGLPAGQASRGSLMQDSEHTPAGAGLAEAIGMVSRHITPERSQLAWSDDVVATACEPLWTSSAVLTRLLLLQLPQLSTI